MGRIICKTHGRQPVVELCHHIYNVIQIQKTFVQQSDFKEVKISYEDIDLELNNLEDCSSHYFCNQCVKKYNLPIDQPIFSNDRDNTYRDAFKNMKLICVKCLQENIIK